LADRTGHGHPARILRHRLTFLQARAMSRPIRIEVPGAVYHVTSRGQGQQPIFQDDEDRQFFVEWLGKIVQRFHWQCHAYCLLLDHYHLVIETTQANLSAGMRELNGSYTQRYNRRYARHGPVMQGRFKAILLERESFLLPVCRHVLLNPLRLSGNRARQLEKYRWSSYLTTAGLATGSADPVPGLSMEGLLAEFGKRKKRASERFQEYVKQGIGQSAPWAQVQRQILLGSDAFVSRMQALMTIEAKVKPKIERPSLKKIFAKVKDRGGRNEAIRKANREYLYRLHEIGSFIGLHLSTVSKIANGVA
jgi:REP element-mobilizing transposase RayT